MAITQDRAAPGSNRRWRGKPVMWLATDNGRNLNTGKVFKTEVSGMANVDIPYENLIIAKSSEIK
jgi:hypothetical protein